MQTIKVKSIWSQGFKRIGVPEKYILKAIKDKEDIEFIFEADGIKLGSMLVGTKKLKSSIKGYSDEFDDKFGRGKYRLAYYEWLPETEEQALKRFSEQCL